MFSSGDAFFQHKTPTAVRVEFANAQPAEGHVFLAAGDRLSDLLNDPRPFFPLRRTDGQVVIVGKKYVVSISERIAAAHELSALALKPKSEPKDSESPYTLLQVAPDAPIEDILASCRKLTEELLPAGLTNADAGDQKIRPALRAAKKILNAYKTIMKERGLTASSTAVAGGSAIRGDCRRKTDRRRAGS